MIKYFLISLITIIVLVGLFLYDSINKVRFSVNLGDVFKKGNVSFGPGDVVVPVNVVFNSSNSFDIKIKNVLFTLFYNGVKVGERVGLNSESILLKRNSLTVIEVGLLVYLNNETIELIKKKVEGDKVDLKYVFGGRVWVLPFKFSGSFTV